MKTPSRRTVPVILVCHFVSTLAALGMPPFFALILQRSLHTESAALAGWLYVLPTVFTALASPGWGRLADRFGKRPLLLRAQLGLAASFLLAGFATRTWVFALALALQGALGGTFSASNAYLATMARGRELAKGLTLMQASARAAMVAAPMAFGLLMGVRSPIHLYRWLALLPLLSALAVWRLEEAPEQVPVEAERASASCTALEITPREIYWLQFAFIFGTVVTFPYLVPFVLKNYPGLRPGHAGFIFALQHLIYLALALPLTRCFGHRSLLPTFAVVCALVIASLLGQAHASSLTAFLAWRCVLGLAMTTGYVVLHAMVSQVIRGDRVGATFGWFESSSKWGAVAAGFLGGFLAKGFGLRGPFWLGALGVAPALAYLALVRRRPALEPLPAE